jgi:hypothetical protein
MSWLSKILDRKPKPKKPKHKVRFWFVSFGPDEPIAKPPPMKLEKPIKPGFRRPFTITPDEPVDRMDNGQFITAEVTSGDSTVTIDPGSTATAIKGFLNGDGSIGDKSVRFTADGHIGDGVVSVTLDIEYTVTTPDATVLGFTEGTDEPIPTT